MPCVPIPVLPFPVLPAGFSISPPSPYPRPYPPGICCQIFNISSVGPPIPLPSLIVNSTFIAALTVAMKTVQTYIDTIPLNCPKE